MSSDQTQNQNGDGPYSSIGGVPTISSPAMSSPTISTVATPSYSPFPDSGSSAGVDESLSQLSPVPGSASPLPSVPPQVEETISTTPESSPMEIAASKSSEMMPEAVSDIQGQDRPTRSSGEAFPEEKSTSPISSPSLSPKNQGVRGIAIDLLPEMSEKQVKHIQKKGKTNVFAVMLVFSVAAITVGILLLNLLTKADVNKKKQLIAEENAKIVSLQYIELKQRTFMTKVQAYEAVREFDFSSDVVLEYLLETASGLSNVRSISLDENLTFSFSGTTDSYINVARLWHDMANQQDYFSTISLDGVSKNENEDGTVVVSFSFSGSMIKENVDKL